MHKTMVCTLPEMSRSKNTQKGKALFQIKGEQKGRQLNPHRMGTASWSRKEKVYRKFDEF